MKKTNDEIVEHKCSDSSFSDDDEIKVLYGPSIDPEWEKWILQISSFADEKEVEMGETDYVGELTYQTQLVIRHCPFCGMYLQKDR